MSHEHAKTIMENGGKWASGMRSESGIRISHSLGTYPSGIRDGDDRVRPDNVPAVLGELPDLNDGPTRRAFWDQLEEVVDYFECARGGGEAKVYMSHGAPEGEFSGTETETLAAAFVWLESVR